MLEVFSDISYGASADHRSIQGMVVCYGGVPIAWQCAVQPLVAHSTAEAELIAYCESLVIGKATEALLCAIWGEEVSRNKIERIIYGDNAAAIGLAHGVTTSSWRTRHLRIRASVLREALAETTMEFGGGWKLLHLKGTELVADGCTKPLCGQAFFRFVEDLGLKRTLSETSSTSREVTTSSGGDTDGAAMRAMVLGSLLLSTVEGKNESGDTVEEDFTFNWMAGTLLIALGAIKMGQLLCDASKCCLRRLRAYDDEVKHRSRSMRDESEASDGEDILVISEDEATALARRRGTTVSSGPMQRSFSSSAGSLGEGAEGTSSMSTRPQSGSRGIGDRTSSLTFRPQSGLCSAAERSTSLTASSRSGLAVVAAAGDPAASSSAAEAVIVGGVESSGSSKGGSKKPHQENPWNVFQHAHRGKGLDSTSLAMLYKEEKAKGPGGQ